MKTDFILIASRDTGFINGLIPILETHRTQIEQTKSESDFLIQIQQCLIAIVDVDSFVNMISVQKLSFHEKVICVYNNLPPKASSSHQVYFYKNDSIEKIDEQINKIMQRQNKISRLAQHYKLSSRETELLKLILNGSTNKEIAARLAISIRKVDTHKRTILRKTDCKNMQKVKRLFRDKIAPQ